MPTLIQILRPINLIIIGLTILVWRLGWWAEGPGEEFPVLDLMLRMAVMMVLAGAGNVINDYFDQRVDRINRPGTRIIGVHMRPQVAIRYHGLLSLLAVSLAGWLSWQTHDGFFVAVALILGLALYLYSPFFKSSWWMGNVTVALCVGILPFWSIWSTPLMDDPQVFRWTGAFAFFAFAMTMAREIVKDLEDMNGDEQYGLKTFPLVFGVKAARWWAIGWISSVIAVWLTAVWPQQSDGRLASGTLLLIAGLGVIMYQLRPSAQNKSVYSWVSIQLKVVMVGGLILALSLAH